MDSVISQLQQLSVAATADSPPAAGSPLLALPLELRTKIYEELLYPSKPFVKKSKKEEQKCKGGQESRSNESRYVDDEYDWSDPYAPKQDDMEDIEDAEFDEYREYLEHIEPEDAEELEGVLDAEDSENGETIIDDLAISSDNLEGAVRRTEIAPNRRYWSSDCASFGIDPAILRVNKQIHGEAIPLLYKRVSCTIDLHEMPLASILLAQTFNRIDPDYKAGSREPSREFRYRFPNTPIARWLSEYRRPLAPSIPSSSDVMLLDCLWRVPRIEISNFYMPSPIDERIDGKYRLTLTGTFIVQFLRRLNLELAPAVPIAKQLYLTISGHDKPFESQLEQVRRSSTGPRALSGSAATVQFQGLIEIITLLRSIRKSRTVVFQEFVGSYYTLGRKDIDLDHLAWTEALSA